MMALTFRHPARGVLQITLDGITYTATHYPSGGPGTRQYWTIRTDDRDPDDDNDWYEPSERRVREAIVAVAFQRRRRHERTATR